MDSDIEKKQEWDTMEVLSMSTKLKHHQKQQSIKKEGCVIVDLVDQPISFHQFKCDDMELPCPTVISRTEKENKLQPIMNDAPSEHIAIKELNDKVINAGSKSVKTRATTTTTAKSRASRLPVKSKIEKEFEKLNDIEKQEFLSKLQDSYEHHLDANNPNSVLFHNSASTKIEPGASLKGTSELNSRNICPASLPEEKELTRLRLELGDVLNRQADLKAKEKKLRLSIKKIQRKLATAAESITYDIHNENLDEIVSVLFPRFVDTIHSFTLKSNAPSISACPMWMMAQQSNQTERLCNEKRISVERDATLLVFAPASDSNIVVNNTPACGDSNNGNSITVHDIHNATMDSDEIQQERSLFSQLIYAMESPCIPSTAKGTGSEVDDQIQQDKINQFANRWIEVVLQERVSSANMMQKIEEFTDSAAQECVITKELLELTIRTVQSKKISISCLEFQQLILSWICELIIISQQAFNNNSNGFQPESLMMILVWILVKHLILEEGKDVITINKEESTNGLSIPQTNTSSNELIDSVLVSSNFSTQKRYREQIETSQEIESQFHSPDNPSKRAKGSSSINAKSSLLIDLTSPAAQCENIGQAQSDCLSFEYDLDTYSNFNGGDVQLRSEQPPQSQHLESKKNRMVNEEGIFDKFKKLAASHYQPSVSFTSDSMLLDRPSPVENETVQSYECVTAHSMKSEMEVEVNDTAVKSVLRSNLDLYQDVLMYIPLNLDEVHRRMHCAGHKVTKEKLKIILDSLCIFQTSGNKR